MFGVFQPILSDPIAWAMKKASEVWHHSKWKEEEMEEGGGERV